MFVSPQIKTLDVFTNWGEQKLLPGYFPDNPIFRSHLERLRIVMNLTLISLLSNNNTPLNNNNPSPQQKTHTKPAEI